MSETFDDLMAGADPDLAALARSARDLILRIDPESVESVRLGDRSATYGVGPRKMKEGYCYLIVHTRWVNLGFYQGAHLDDPSGLLEGTGRALRHVKVRSPADLEDPALHDLVRAAVAERRTAVAG